MSISLSRAVLADAGELYNLQKQSFMPLLIKYKDYTTNPAAEPPQQIETRLLQKNTEYYFILLDGKRIGAIRVCVFKGHCRISPIFVLPQYQNNGYAYIAMQMIEKQYPKIYRWELESIKEETKLCYFYEKLGYRPTGIKKKLSLGMTLIGYEKILEKPEKEKSNHGNL